MKKVLKQVLFYGLLLYSFVSSAQTELKKDSDAGNAERKMQTIETLITNYINSNISSYKLPQAVIEEITSTHHADAARELEALLEEAKRNALRKQYFELHPDADVFIHNTAGAGASKFTCTNGGFEDPISTEYVFYHQSPPVAFMMGCPTPSINHIILPIIPDPAYPVYVASQGVDGWLDPLGVQMQTVATGTKSVKLTTTINANYGEPSITSMTRDLVVNDPFFDFKYSLIMADPYNLYPNQADNAFFRVNIKDKITGQILLQPICIYEDAPANNPIFQIVTGNPSFEYTGWVCEHVDVHDLIGQEVTIEFTIATSKWGPHYGTVYLDDLCGYSCCPPFITLTSADDINTGNVNYERANWIRATNTITGIIPPTRVIYKAGDFIELNPRFETQVGTEFAAYISPCPSAFIYRSNNHNSANPVKDQVPKYLFNEKSDIVIYPNPATDIVNIETGNIKFERVSITSLDGRKWYDNSFGSRNTLQLNTSKYGKGMYIISITADNGKVYSRKLVKL